MRWIAPLLFAGALTVPLGLLYYQPISSTLSGRTQFKLGWSLAVIAFVGGALFAFNPYATTGWRIFGGLAIAAGVFFAIVCVAMHYFSQRELGRRFIRNAEARAAGELYEFHSPEDFRQWTAGRVNTEIQMGARIVDAVTAMYEAEWRPTEWPELPPLRWGWLDEQDKEFQAWCDSLDPIYERMLNAKAIMDFYREAAVKVALLMQGVPETTSGGRFQVELTDIYENLGWVVGGLSEIFWTKEALDLGVAESFRETFRQNRRAVSLRFLPHREYESGKLIQPGYYPGPPEHVADAYLTGTPLLRLFH